MYQQLTLIGNLGNDPELRYTPNGVPVASFSLAVSKSFTKDGQRQEKTTWFRVSAWNKQAETVSQYLKKGSKALVVGELEEVRMYIDKSGATRVSLEVTAQTIRFMDSKPSGNGEPQQETAPAPHGDDRDIPF